MTHHLMRHVTARTWTPRGDEASVTKAFDGAYGAFLVTNFWAHMSAEQEKQDALNMARAAKATSLTHVVWSTLDDTREHIPLDDDRMPSSWPTARTTSDERRAARGSRRRGLG